MSRDEAAYVADMLEACERICTYVVDLNERTLRDDTKTVDAVLRNLAVVGEAAKRVSRYADLLVEVITRDNPNLVRYDAMVPCAPAPATGPDHARVGTLSQR